MAFRRAFELQAAIARAVGVEPSETTRIVIDVTADGAPKARITKYLTVEQEEKLIRLFEATAFEEVV
jgi:hypothetical protein